MKRKKILFICVHNSGRSQIAEEILKKYGGELYEAESAGLEPTEINPMVTKVLLEKEGIDIIGKKAVSVSETLRKGHIFWEVVTVCDRTTHMKCPVFPGIQQRLLWPFPDPEEFTGTEEEKIKQTEELIESIKQKIMDHFKI